MDDITGSIEHEAVSEALSSHDRGGKPRVRALGGLGSPMDRVSVADDQVSARIELTTRDPEVVGALAELLKDESDASLAVATDYVKTALRVGVIALRQARPTVDERSLRNAGEQLVGDLRTAVEKQSVAIKGLLEAQIEKGLKHSLAEYLDPKSGKFSSRADALTALQEKLQKDLPAAIAEQMRQTAEQQLSGDNSKLAAMIAQQVGKDSAFVRMFDPAHKSGVIASIEEKVKSLLDEQRTTVLAEFSMDNDQSAIKRLLNGVESISKGLKDDFSLDKDGSALKRLNDQLAAALQETQSRINEHLDINNDKSSLKRIKRELQEQLAEFAKKQVEATSKEAEEARKFQTDVRQILTDFTARKDERAKGTGHGLDFEQALLAEVSRLSGPDDRVRFVASHVGVISNCKVGDVELAIAPGPDSASDAEPAKVIFEAKDVEKFTCQDAEDEIQVAVKNRRALVGVFVMSAIKANPLHWHRRLERRGNNIFVLWHPERPETDPYLEAAIALARGMAAHLVRTEADTPDVDWTVIDKSAAEIEKQCERFEKIQTSCKTIHNAAENISKDAINMADKISKSLANLAIQLDSLRSGTSGDASGT